MEAGPATWGLGTITIQRGISLLSWGSQLQVAPLRPQPNSASAPSQAHSTTYIFNKNLVCQHDGASCMMGRHYHLLDGGLTFTERYSACNKKHTTSKFGCKQKEDPSIALLSISALYPGYCGPAVTILSIWGGLKLILLPLSIPRLAVN